MEKNILSRESLLNFKSEPKEFEIKNYGNVFVRSLSSGEGLKLRELYQESNLKDPLISEKTVILGICDQSGQPLFTDSDLNEIRTLPFELVQAMALAVVSGNGMDPEGIKRAEGN